MKIYTVIFVLGWKNIYRTFREIIKCTVNVCVYYVCMKCQGFKMCPNKKKKDLTE